MVVAGPKLIPALLATVTKKAVEAEMASDRQNFAIEDLDTELHRRATRAGLAVRLWLEKEKLTAFTVNSLAVDKASGLGAIPFLEAGKAMVPGIGYAGEGDVLTTSLVGTLLQVYPENQLYGDVLPRLGRQRGLLKRHGRVEPQVGRG